MAQRDLTYNLPPGFNEASESLRNPFASSRDEENSSFVTNEGSSAKLDDNSPSGKPFNVYDDYNSQNNTATDFLLNKNKGDRQYEYQDGAKYIQVPSEYDRYPSMIGSRVISSSSLSNQLYPPAKKSVDSDSPTSDKSPKSFLQAAEFSPFGGYPASSFPLHIDEKEPDDYLHNPDPIADAEYDTNRFIYDMKHLDRRSAFGLVGIILLLIAAACLFIVLPVLTYSGVEDHYQPQSYEILTLYKYPILSAIRTNLIDPDTPEDVYTKKVSTGETWKLVFSDEFNAEGRTFYEGDDQFFTAADLHYDATKDLEWYTPDAVTTVNGTLNMKMDAFKNHDLYYRSGMVQSWNKMCFTQGRIEISAMLPNYGNINGLWPGLWTMGNLGRPGYLASTEGVWPYTYDSCDAGITANQSSPDGISYLPGQRLNSCTCKGEAHPNPGVGRGAPELDIIEAEMNTVIGVGVASQSMQIAPFDIWYMPDYNFIKIYNLSVTTMNTYAGGPFQEAVSGTTTLNTSWYEMGDTGHNYQMYGFEYLNDNDEGYFTWLVGVPTLTVHAYALGPNGNVGWRRISKEPMSIIMNLGISNNWAYIDWASLHFPVTLRVDHVRVYQPEDAINLTCDPVDYPTYDYIQSHLDIYLNVNLTSFEKAGYTWPKNSLVNGCST